MESELLPQNNVCTICGEVAIMGTRDSVPIGTTKDGYIVFDQGERKWWCGMHEPEVTEPEPHVYSFNYISKS